MGIRSQLERDLPRIGRLLWTAVLGTVGVVGLVLGPSVLGALVPQPVQTRMLIVALQTLRLVYVAMTLVVPILIVMATLGLVLGRRYRRLRAVMMRVLATSLALGLSIGLAEGCAAVRLAWTRIPKRPVEAPAATKREPVLAHRFENPRGDRTVNIVVLGASSAHGDPYDSWFSPGAIVAWKLGEAIPDRKFTLECLAQPGISLEQVHKSLENLHRRPGLAILYSGHNEFAMRYPWARDTVYYHDTVPPPSLASPMVDEVESSSSVCRLIDRTLNQHLLARPPEQKASRGLVDVPVYYAHEYAELLRDFRDRLEAITTYCEQLGARVVLVIPPANDADFEPSRSFLPPETPRVEREAFAREVEAARRLERDDPVAARAAYQQLVERQPEFAETLYRLARLEEKAGHLDAAIRHYIAARDHDGLPVRCMSEFQDVYREVAARHPDAILIDSPAILRRESPRGVAGDNFFNDAVHPSLIGYTTLSRAILRALQARHAFNWPKGAAPPDLTPTEVAAHYQMDPARWAEVCGNAIWYYDAGALVRFDPSERHAKAARYREAQNRLRNGADPEKLHVPGIGTTVKTVTDP